ncbi:M15 family metallopeptidase [Kineococcus sp. SYSU DK002]|uniref:M15 family metallopeptidase n=1 Tax=Kineococcus sp. SYSU DK002 TaxID=3383123 RepID=UPI003D7EC367
MGRLRVAVLALVPLLAGCAAPAASAPGAAVEVPRQSRSLRTPALPAFTSTTAPVTAADLSASWRPGCPVGPERLRVVTVSTVDLTGRASTGRIVVHADVAGPVTAIFAQLYALRFPVARMEPVEAFGGSDDASMAADNTSGFNCRATTGGTGFSEHSYGTAIDLNPVENPYVKGTTVLPEAGRAFVDRRPAPGVVLAGDAVVHAFAEHGFSWGGDWRSLKDYQHFSVSGD